MKETKQTPISGELCEALANLHEHAVLLQNHPLSEKDGPNGGKANILGEAVANATRIVRDEHGLFCTSCLREHEFLKRITSEELPGKTPPSPTPIPQAPIPEFVPECAYLNLYATWDTFFVRVWKDKVTAESARTPACLATLKINWWTIGALKRAREAARADGMRLFIGVKTNEEGYRVTRVGRAVDRNELPAGAGEAVCRFITPTRPSRRVERFDLELRAQAAPCSSEGPGVVLAVNYRVVPSQVNPEAQRAFRLGVPGDAVYGYAAVSSWSGGNSEVKSTILGVFISKSEAARCCPGAIYVPFTLPVSTEKEISQAPSAN